MKNGLRDPNVNPEIAGVDLAHPGAPDEFRDQNRPVAPAYERAPEPGPEVAGPAMFNLVQETRRALDVQSRLIVRAIPLLNNRIIVERHSVETDANGNADLVLYRVPQGMQFVVTRLIVENATNNAGTPFSAAGAWIALILGDRYQPGSIRDFAPNPANAGATPLLPWVFSDGNEEASVFRGGETVGLHIVGTATLANQDIWATLQGHEFPV